MILESIVQTSFSAQLIFFSILLLFFSLPLSGDGGGGWERCTETFLSKNYF